MRTTTLHHPRLWARGPGSFDIGTSGYNISLVEDDSTGRDGLQGTGLGSAGLLSLAVFSFVPWAPSVGSAACAVAAGISGAMACRGGRGWFILSLAIGLPTVTNCLLGVDSPLFSPGFPACGAALGFAVALVRTGARKLPAGAFADALVLAFVIGAMTSAVVAPRDSGISKGDIDEEWDGMIVARRHFFVESDPEHSQLALKLPGSTGVPWSVGHPRLLPSSDKLDIVVDGARFLPVRNGTRGFPLWTYIGGGGGGIPPITPVSTRSLMGNNHQ